MEKFTKYSTEASCFEEAFPLGNGSLGAMAFCGAQNDKILINHDTLWSGKPHSYKVEGAFESYEKAKALVKEGKCYEAQVQLEKNFTGPWSNAYLMFGNLHIERKDKTGNISGYNRSLNFEDGVASAVYKEEDGTKTEKEYFVSYPDNCIALKIKTSNKKSYNIYFESPLKSTSISKDNKIISQIECPSEMIPFYGKSGYSTPVYDGKGIKATGMFSVKTDGNTVCENGKITLYDAKETVICFCVETSFIEFDKSPDKETLSSCEKHMEELAKKTYESLKDRHISDFSSLYNSASVYFGSEDKEEYTDKRLKDGTKSIALCNLLYNFGRYLIISSSREGSRATNLQGIWNDSMTPPWSSNYTVNINTEMNYWPVLSSNLASCYEPIIKLVEDISKSGAETAKNFYKASGFVSHHNADLWGHTTPVGDGHETTARFAYWNMSGAWLCRNLFEYYEYTLDKTFLKEKLYPIMKECAKFFLSIMENYNGNWIVTPSTSPENAYIDGDGNCVFVALYTTMSQSIVQDLFTNVLKCAKELNIKDEFTKEIEEKLPNIGIYKTGSRGQLLEYDKEYKEEDVHHRHMSHLYALYPADLITTENSPKLSEACRRTLEIRGDESTGWSMGWKVNLWAKLKDGDRALKIVKTQLNYVEPSEDGNYHKGGTYPNMFDAHPPFQIDGNFGVVSGMNLMFLQCEDGKIKILPALPKEMENGYAKGLLAKGNIKTDIEWEKGKLKSLKFVTPFEQNAIINIDGKDTEIHLLPNIEYAFM